jgi:hypothetical protein
MNKNRPSQKLARAHVTLSELATRIRTGEKDIDLNEWGQSDAVHRPKNVESLPPNQLRAIIWEMAKQGKITPLSLANGEPLETPSGETSWLENASLTSKDADIAVQCLRVAVALMARERAQERAKLEAGRYTLEEAATKLSDNTGLDIDRWRKTLLTEVKQGKLPLRNPRDYGDLLPYAVPDQQRGTPAAACDFLLLGELVTSGDLNNCLKRAEWQITYRFPTVAAARKAKKKKTTNIHQQMVQEFRRVIVDELILDPDALPLEKRGKNGNAGVRSMVAKALKLSASTKSFERHWERAFEKGELSWVVDKSR